MRLAPSLISFLGLLACDRGAAREKEQWLTCSVPPEFLGMIPRPRFLRGFLS
jgi:hypothetical protein